MSLTLEKCFGASASLSNGELKIKLNDLSTGGLDGADPSPPQILSGILLAFQAAQGEGAEDNPTIGITVQDFGKTFANRGGISQLSYQKLVTFYVNDTTEDNLDPDEVV